MLLADSVRNAIGETLPSDRAVADLAITYAQRIDDGGELEKLGPALLNTLEALGLTPRARKNVMKGAESGRSALDELRQRREARDPRVNHA